MGFVDMKNSTDTLSNMYDVTKILFADWSVKLFIIMHEMDHKTLLYGFMNKFLHFMMSSKYRFLVSHADLHCKVFRD